jgi:PAS domain S-box-containing protein
MLPTPRVAATDPALRVQQLDLLYSTLPFSLASSLGLATLATVPLWSVVPHLNVALWLAAHVALTFGRILAWRRWKLGSVELQSPLLLTTFRVTASLAGAAWGALAVVCYPSELSHQVFIAFVVAGVSAGAVTSLSADRFSAQIFATLCVLPIAIQLLRAPDNLSRSMGIMILAYLGFLSFNAQRSGRQIIETIRLRLWSDKLQRAASQQYTQLRNVLDSATRVAIIATDLDGLVQVFNSGAEFMLGYRSQDIVGKSSALLWHLPSEIDTRARELSETYGTATSSGFAALAQHALSGRPDEGRWTFVRADGSRLTVNLIVTGARNEQGHLVGFIAIATDITAQLRAEEETATTRSQLEAFVEHVPAAVAMFDKNLRYLAYSRRWLSDFDLGMQRLQGRLHAEILPEVAHDWSTTLQRCLAGAVERREEDALQRADGTLQWLKWEARPWFDSHGEIGGVIMVAEDITVRRATSDALRASTELLRKLSDRVPGAIYKYRHGSPGVREFRFVSAGASVTLGIEAAALMKDAAGFFARIHPEDLTIKLTQLSTATDSNAVRACEYRVLTHEQELRWVRDEAVGELENGTELMFYGHITDVTERKAAEEERARLAERMELATHAGGIGVWEFDVAQRSLEWDRRMFNVHGISSESRHITWERWLGLIEPPDRARLESALQPTAAANFDTEYRVIGPEASIRHIKMSAHVERNMQGNPLRLVGVSWDVTELKRVERMKSEFVSTVSHELRTPLTSLRGSLGLLVGGALDRYPERAHSMIQLAARNADRLALLIDDLLDLEKMEAGKMRFEIAPVDLVTVIRQGVETNDGLTQRYAVRFAFDAPLAASIKVNADPYRVQQVLSNLLSNAAKFSPQGSEVRIAVQPSAGLVRVAVIDQGSGVPNEFLPRLFEKFSQADSSDSRSKGGTGLGLAVCKAIIDALGGTIGYESTYPRGATFFFELPIASSS